MKMPQRIGFATCTLAILVAVVPAMGDETINGNLNVTGNVNAGVAVQGQYAIYANGKADGGDTIYQSLGFDTWYMDNYSGRLRFTRSASVLMYLDVGGLHITNNLYSRHMILDNGAADGPDVVLRSSGFNPHQIDNRNGVMRFLSPGRTNLVVSATGDVGIATTTPATKLDVNGHATVRGDMICEVVDIRGEGALDVAEAFKVNDALEVQPGMVVAIDPANAGELTLTRAPYDRKVAGIVSGAGDLKAGIHLGGKLAQQPGHHPVALTGRVWCRADATARPIQPGDLLTSSAAPGHAMAVADYARAQGAIIGKAMTPLAEGKGLVLVLVSLQ